jgi:hypothetical protein
VRAGPDGTLTTAVSTDPSSPPVPEPLPPRDPRPLVVHFGVDAAVAFLALLVVGLILGIPWLVTAVVALVIGVVAAPFTRRAEIRALAGRPRPSS